MPRSNLPAESIPEKALAKKRKNGVTNTTVETLIDDANIQKINIGDPSYDQRFAYFDENGQLLAADFDFAAFNNTVLNSLLAKPDLTSEDNWTPGITITKDSGSGTVTVGTLEYNHWQNIGDYYDFAIYINFVVAGGSATGLRFEVDSPESVAIYAPAGGKIGDMQSTLNTYDAYLQTALSTVFRAYTPAVCITSKR